jgi:hypothetical protein
MQSIDVATLTFCCQLILSDNRQLVFLLQEWWCKESFVKFSESNDVSKAPLHLFQKGLIYRLHPVNV